MGPPPNHITDAGRGIAQDCERAIKTPFRVLIPGLSWPIETFVERLLTGLSAEGVHLTFASNSRPPTSWLSAHRITWIPGPTTRGARTVLSAARRRDAGAIRLEVAALISRSALADQAVRSKSTTPRWDVVYVPWLNTLIAHPFLFDLEIPVVTSCRGSLVTVAPWNPDRTELRDALPHVFRRCKLVHCVSQDIVNVAEPFGLERSKARVITPAVDPEAFTPRPKVGISGVVTVVGVGTLTWVKDYARAIGAVRLAVDRGVDVQLRLIGSGRDREHLLYTAHDLNVADRVQLLGRCTPDQVAQELQRADLFLHTSCSEGISNAALEAMACGLPAITTDAGGMAEAVRDGMDGIVVKVRDTGALADAMCLLATDLQRRAAMGESARNRVATTFSLDRQLSRFRSLLDEASGP